MNFINVTIFKSVLFLGVGFSTSFLFEIATKKWALWDKKIGWQFHHSLFGFILILSAVLIQKYRMELIFAGFGIILQHTLSDGFVFIRKWK